MNNIGSNTVLSSVRTDYLGGGIQNGTDTVVPTGPTPNQPADLNIVAGWPLYWLFPNREHASRYSIDASMLLADLDGGTGVLRIPPGLSIMDTMERYVDASVILQIGDLSTKWHMNVPKCEISLGDEYDSVMSTGQIATTTSYYSVDNGVDSADPVAEAISNHFIVQYGALERGFGRMKHGWFYADVGGLWNWSVDGLDAVEVAIDGGVVASKYSNSSAVGQGVLYGSMSLTAGWHHLFAYTSDRSDAAYPKVWFKRPGDPTWTQLAPDASDGIVWCRGAGVPDYVSFDKSGGFLTIGASYAPGVSCTVSVLQSDFGGGPLSVSSETVPRYRTYYTNAWADSSAVSIPCPASRPPEFVGIRGVMEFGPISEMLFYLEDTPVPTYVQKLLVSGDGIFWYRWNGTSFSATSADSIEELLANGTSMYDLNNVPESAWTTFVGAKKTCKVMFTGHAPLALIRNNKLLMAQAGAEYIVGTKSIMSGTVSLNKKQI